MYKRIFHYRFISITMVLYEMLYPVISHAAALPCSNSDGLPGLPCLTTANPTANIGSYLFNIRKSVLGFSAALAVLFIIFGGFLYLSSAGNEERVKKAKATITYAIIGLILILLAGVILSLITGDLLSPIFTGPAPYSKIK